MDKHDFPEEFFPPEPNENQAEDTASSVDFSDLGDLFADSSSSSEDSVFDPIPQGTQDDLDLSQFALSQEEPEEDELDLQALNDLLSEKKQDPAEPEASDDSAYNSADSTEEDSQETATVLPGEAAWLLQRLRELPPDPEDPYHPKEAREEPSEASYEEPEYQDTYEQPQEISDPAEDLPQDEPEQEDAYDPVPQEMEPLTQEDPPAPQEETPAEAVQEPKKRVRKGRPKRKKGEGFFGIPNLVVTAVWIAITVLIGVTLGRMIWVCAADVLAFGREDKPVTVTIYEADTIEDITKKLHDGGLIHYPGLFKLYASFAVDEGEIHPGIWDLNTRYDYHALVNMMSPSSSREVIELMIPEGYSSRQIFALMEEKKICTALDLGSYAAAGELDDYWFLEGVERGDMYCLEGFLFPDTYQFYKNDSPRAVLQKMLNNFESKFDETMIAQIGNLNDHLAELMKKGGHGDDYIASHQFDVRDVVIVASLIEKETSSAEEGYTIASVIYNRLYNWGDHPPLLNIDASIVYALGGKTDLTQEDLKVQSPYNTYLNTGLTPGPIANPGLASIQAAMDPQDTNYYFYVLDPAQGSHVFTTTYEEHQTAKASVGG